jgi:predicted AlkP superfamily pyrophosphatase or phosphodiesterase
LGFWCEWTYSPENSPFRRLRPVLGILSLAERWHLAERVIHRVLDELRWVSSTKNIALANLADFSETGCSVLNERFDQESILDHPELNKFIHLQFANTTRRDEEVFLAAKRHIEAAEDPGHVFVTFSKLDHCSHWEGVGSEPYDRMLLENDRYIRVLSEFFLAKVADGAVLVVSDHGMVNVKHEVRVDLEGRFGRPRTSGYAYFSEGTILRVWCESEALKELIRSYLDEVEGLERLRDEERPGLGLTLPGFGDLIYHTLEGCQLVPSYWGSKPSAAMHGYHPRYRSQHGVCLSTRAGDFDGEVSATDFYRLLSGYLGVTTG